MAFPIDQTSGPDAVPIDPPSALDAGALEQLEQGLSSLGITSVTRTPTSLVFEAGLGAPWPFKCCAGHLEIVGEGAQSRLTTHFVFRAWSLIMAVVVPFIAYLLLGVQVGLAPVLQFALLFISLPLGWIGAMALIKRLLGGRVRRHFDRLLLER